MIRNARRRIGAWMPPSLLAMACILWSAPALAAQSSALAVSADLTTDGVSHVQLAPQLLTSGSTDLGQSFSQPLSAPLLSRALRLQPASLRGPTLTVLEERVATLAAGAFLIDAMNAHASSSAASGIVSLVSYPSMIAAPLRVQFTKLKATASYAQVFRAPSRRSGSTTFGELILSGPLVGPKPLRFSGDIEPNTVVVNTPSVKITLHAQRMSQQPVCKADLACPQVYVPEAVETRAVQIQLNNAVVLGRQVTGEIVIGAAQAGQ